MPRIDVPRTDGGGGGGDGGSTGGDGGSSGGDGGMCIAGGAACTQGSSVCCADYACGVQPGGSFCCRPQMGQCTNSRQCCGSMLCNIASGATTGTCQCQAREAVCSNDLDCCGGAHCNLGDGGTTGTCACVQEFGNCTADSGCCSGLTCHMGRCLRAGCFAPGEVCDMSDAGACCGGYSCNIQPSGQHTCCRGPALTTDEPPVTCQSGAECCGSVPCVGGVCVCQRANQSCFYATDCCGAMQCMRPGGASMGMGTCQCQARGNYCRTNGNDCCAGTSCVNNVCS